MSIDYPKDKTLRLNLAGELRKLQSDPARRKAVEKAEKWPEYAAEVIENLMKIEEQKEAESGFYYI